MITILLRMLKTLLPVLAFIIISLSAAYAADYYVDPNGSDTNAGTADSPWQTITMANQVLYAGDTVHIRAGTYSSFIAPQNSGTSSEPITYINDGSDTVIVSNAEYGIHLNGKSHIIVQGINFYNLDKFLWLENGSDRNTIGFCNFDHGRTIGWSGSKIYRSSSYNRVHHCTFSHYGYYTNDDIGSVLDIGNEYDTADLSQYNLIENNTMYHGGHHVLGIFGMYTVVRNNYFHNEIWDNGYGDRVLFVNGYPSNSGRNLIEGNRIAYSAHPPDNWGAAGMSLANSYNIIRMNSFYHNDLAGISVTTSSSFPASPTYNRIYHNTLFHNGINSDPNAGQELLAGIGFANYGGLEPIVGNAVKNNIFRSNPKSYGTYRVFLSDQIFAGNWEESGDPLFVNADTVLGDPMNSVLPDLHLSSNSPSIDAGAHLTRILSQSGCGITFQVEDAGYFMDGWGIVQGDIIQIFNTAEKARITTVDYGTNTIKVDAALVWTQHDAIGLAYQGNAPDVGAHETVIDSAVHTVTLVSGENGSICPDTQQMVTDGLRTKFAVAANTGYAAVIEGTCGGTLVENVYTTDSVYADCTAIVNFSLITHIVTPSAGDNGTITPGTAQEVNDGSPATFTVTANSGYTASVGGTCGGTLVGTVYTTNPVHADCTVSANFSLITHIVTPGAGPNGTINPSTPQMVIDGAQAAFTVSPNSGYTATVGGTCGGTLAGTVYTTNPVHADCSVFATFSRITHTVTPSAGPNGRIRPSTPQVVNQGSRIRFRVTADRGYTASVGGTCGGRLYGTIYTTSPVYADCTVIATFRRRY